MFNLSSCDYSDAYMLVEGRITVIGQGANNVAVAAHRNNKEVVFKSCAPFIDYITKINIVEVDNANDFDIAMLMNTLIIKQKHQLLYGKVVETNQIMI